MGAWQKVVGRHDLTVQMFAGGVEARVRVVRPKGEDCTYWWVHMNGSVLADGWADSVEVANQRAERAAQREVERAANNLWGRR